MGTKTQGRLEPKIIKNWLRCVSLAKKLLNGKRPLFLSAEQNRFRRREAADEVLEKAGRSKIYYIAASAGGDVFGLFLDDGSVRGVLFREIGMSGMIMAAYGFSSGLERQLRVWIWEERVCVCPVEMHKRCVSNSHHRGWVFAFTVCARIFAGGFAHGL